MLILDVLSFDSELGKSVFWHSSAHVLGQALEAKYKELIQLCNVPSLEDGGFFYEFWLKDKNAVSEKEFRDIETLCKRIVKEKQPFERLQVSRQFAANLFAYSDFKLKVRNLLGFVLCC